MHGLKYYNDRSVYVLDPTTGLVSPRKFLLPYTYIEIIGIDKFEELSKEFSERSGLVGFNDEYENPTLEPGKIKIIIPEHISIEETKD